MSTTIALVTGANKGVGLATARQLAERGLTVYLGSRDRERGAQAAAGLAEAGVEVRPLEIDITDDASVGKAVDFLTAEHGRLDVLVNNAGILHRKPALEVTAEDLAPEFETNVYGLVRVIHAVLPLLRRSAAPRVVNVSSTSAVFALAADPETMFARSHDSFAYAATKAAVNMLTVKYANAFRADPGLAHVKINAITPGYVATDMNDFHGTRTTEEGARASVKLALLGPDGPSGGFFDEDGPMPW
ncbi:NAD(P)-dependent dehydrogenase (short-subunit alcohol dehydrogenase family) [Crossiella equi]|uniref:NAD(P)-dependent dehydrogenase (Short-subunit alcohol dehydrogenase family) n=1 Tax=Crossiella equi TaxID=130796 RepID=A0ABS5A4P3_9PSEU|nr:SDR family NAD(P)-dependent oxidoreductase [Crossiella equi]MBP2471204.1 NAD(P)-dependent dehydrogenase (short-subunit alcohol dehydrogenase family) [Crossiella equi]